MIKKLKSNKNIRYPIKVKYSNSLKDLLDIVLTKYKKILVLCYLFFVSIRCASESYIG